MGVQLPRSLGGPTFSRRALLAGAAASLAGLAQPRIGCAEVVADGWEIIRARGAALGPTLRIKRGEELRVRLINDSSEPAAIHWHGIRVPNGMDGVPGLTQGPVEPGATFEYRFQPPDAGTFWYRPPVTASGQMLRGPKGALIVAEAEPVAVDRDELLFVAALPVPDSAAARPIAVRTNERLRLRVVNALGDALLPLRVDQHRAVVMAIDGEPAEPFAARDSRVMLAPGNRVDLFVDLTLAPGASAPILADLPGGAVPLARLVYEAGAPARPAPLPGLPPLPANPLPERMDFRSAQRLAVPLGDGPPNTAPARPLFSAKRGRTIMLALTNRAAAPYVVHVHGHAVRLLDALDDGWKPFWLDTILVPAQQTARIAFIADNPGKWMLDCRVLGGPEAGAGTWFEVL